MLSKVILKAVRGQRLLRPFAGGHSHGHKEGHAAPSEHHGHGGHGSAHAEAHHDGHHAGDHHDDHHGHHEVGTAHQIKLDLTKAYFRPSAADLKYQTVFGLEPVGGHHDPQPLTHFSIEDEYWYALKDGKWK